jgi:hypothetical protein
LLHTALNSNNDRTISVYEFAHFSDILGSARYEEGRLQAKRVFFFFYLSLFSVNRAYYNLFDGNLDSATSTNYPSPATPSSANDLSSSSASTGALEFVPTVNTL